MVFFSRLKPLKFTPLDPEGQNWHSFHLFPLTALDRNWYVWARTPWSCNVRLPWNVYRTEILKFWHQPKLLEDNEILLSRGISFKDLQRGVVFLFVPGPFWFESCTGRFQAVFLLSTLHSPERPCWMLAVPGSSARRALWTYVEGSEHGKTSCTSFMLAPLVLRWLGRCTWQNISGLMIWFQRGGMYTCRKFLKVHRASSSTNIPYKSQTWSNILIPRWSWLFSAGRNLLHRSQQWEQAVLQLGRISSKQSSGAMQSKWLQSSMSEKWRQETWISNFIYCIYIYKFY